MLLIMFLKETMLYYYYILFLFECVYFIHISAFWNYPIKETLSNSYFGCLKKIFFYLCLVKKGGNMLSSFHKKQIHKYESLVIY
jgi:hypothetical protein